MYRMPSVLVPGEFDHVIIPKCTLTVNGGLKYNKKDIVALKLNINAQADRYLVNPDTGCYEMVLFDQADKPATV